MSEFLFLPTLSINGETFVKIPSYIQVALLIDADNAQLKYIEPVLKISEYYGQLKIVSIHVEGQRWVDGREQGRGYQRSCAADGGPIRGSRRDQHSVVHPAWCESRQ